MSSGSREATAIDAVVSIMHVTEDDAKVPHYPAI